MAESPRVGEPIVEEPAEVISDRAGDPGRNDGLKPVAAEGRIHTMSPGS